MKKLSLFLALSALYTGMQAQPLTGINTYLHNNLTLTEGYNTLYSTPGFMLAGYHAGSSTYPITIDKTDVDGMFNGSPGEFSRTYQLTANPNVLCGPNSLPPQTPYGISALEAKVPTTSPITFFATASAFDSGCLFMGLDLTGIPVNTAFYAFPVLYGSPTKPLIIESKNTPGTFYVCGSYYIGSVCHMYAFMVSASGALLWSAPADYTIPSGGLISPSAMIESPYSTSPELVIVGTTNDQGVLKDEGFFARLDGTNGSVLEFDGFGTAANANDRFLSIDIAKSGSPVSQGYVIGGYSDVMQPTTYSWLLKIQPTGGGICFSNLIIPSGVAVGGIVGVRERKSSTYNQYEYYGAADCNDGMTVFKFDNNGLPFSQPSNIYNEFIYGDNSGNPAKPAALNRVDDATSNNYGIQVFGTDPVLGHYVMARACFNGAAGKAPCTTANINLNSLGIGNVISPVTASYPAPVNQGSGLAECIAYSIYYTSITTAVTAPCNENIMPSVPFVGNQNRTAVPTGIPSQSENTAQLSVSPNPVSDKLSINYTVATDSKVIISLTNQLGQVVMQPVTSTASQNENSFELNLDKMNLKDGIYFVGININGVNTTRKIVYTK